MSRKFSVIVFLVIGAGGCVLAHAFQQRLRAAAEWGRQVVLATEDAERIRQNIVVPTDQRVRTGENFAAGCKNSR